jgi:sodium/hydrogen antiporter
VAIAAADIESSIGSTGHVVSVAAEEIGYGLLGGVLAGLLTAAVVVLASRHDLIAPAWRQLAPTAGAALAFGLADGFGGSGFIAAFVAGVCFGWPLHGQTATIERFNEELADLLGGVTFVAFGAVLLGPALSHISWQIALYALLSLTVARMVPVALAMLGTRARPQTVAFIGWFGPRGLASIVFALTVVETAHLPNDATIVRAAYLTVGLSVLTHGLSASPLARRYGRWLARQPRERLSSIEVGDAPAMRLRGTRHTEERIGHSHGRHAGRIKHRD